MFNYRVLAIIKRELREKLFSKAFIILTLLVPGMIFIFGGVQALLYSTESKGLKFDLVVENRELLEDFQKEFSQQGFVTKKHYVFNYMAMTREDFKIHLQNKKQMIIDEKLTGILFIPASAFKDKKIEYYAKTPQNISLSRELERPINKIFLDIFFKNKSLSTEDLDFARSGVDFTGFKVSKDEKIAQEGYGNLVLSYALSILLYISLLMIGQMAMQSVIEEKGSKIVEVILSSVSAKELMTGKILGSAITGVAQMAVWLGTIFAISSSALIALPPEVTLNIKPELVIYVLLNFFIGLVLFVGLFSMMGAIFDNSQDAASGNMPIMMLIIIPFFIAISMMENPNKPYIEIASLFPFASIIVMPARLALVEVPVWQQVLAVIINLLTIYALFPLAGKIYRIGILRTGKKPKWSEVVKWLKYKY
ncbi:MAG: ABC transporter permease [Melioribacter sp.]|nr:ABC transporter permease [Melioribacter sp.]